MTDRLEQAETGTATTGEAAVPDDRSLLQKADRTERGLHTPSGRWKRGLLLTLVAVLMWSTIPIALKIVLGPMDAITITWYRYLVAAAFWSLFLARKRALPNLRKLRGRSVVLLAIAAVGLCGSFVLFLSGLKYITPSASQVVIQLAPMFVLLGGVLIFRESFRPVQQVGFLALIAGLVLFFNRQIMDFDSQPGDYWLGVSLILISTVVWASYVLAQKQLLNLYPSTGIMLLLYLAGIGMMLPLSSLGQIANLNSLQLAVLAYCCLNTVVGYGCFSEALAHWEASRVGAVTATTPLFTLVFSELGFLIAPSYVEAEHPNALAVCGALLVVLGCVLAALGKKSNSETAEST